MALDLVIHAAEVADPLVTVFDELDEGVDVGTALSTPHNRVIVKACLRDRLPRWELSVRFDQDGKRNATILLQLIVEWHAICRHAEQ